MKLLRYLLISSIFILLCLQVSGRAEDAYTRKKYIKEQQRKIQEEEFKREKEAKRLQILQDRQANMRLEEKKKKAREAEAKIREEARKIKTAELKREREAQRLRREQLEGQEERLDEKRKKAQEAEAKIKDEVKKIKLAELEYGKANSVINAKQKEDEAKLKEIELLWGRARKLYSQGMYEEAVRYFEKVVELEGNPRIKYTPSAKEYIEKAKIKIGEDKKENLSKAVEDTEKEMINEVIKQQTPPYLEPPARVEEVKGSPLVEPPAIRKKLKEKKIAFDFDKVDLKSVISFLSQEAGVNIIASQKVLELNLKLTASFKDTSIDEIVKYITKSLGVVYRIDKDIIWIAHPEEIEQESLETRVYYLSKGGGLFTEFSPMSSTTDTGLGGSSAQVTKIATIEDTLKEIVPWPQDAKIVYDKRLNALIVKNTPQNLQMLEDILYSLDVTPSQVLIEARFIEVDITDTKEFGIEWKNTADATIESKAGTGGLFSHGIAKDSGVDFSSFSRVSEGMNFTYKGVLTAPQFSVVLHALEETKKLKTLSSPRITTLNNQMATIKVVDEWIYPTRYEYEVVQSDINGDGDFSDAGETTYKNVPKDFLRRDVGILLKVIPAVGADRKTINLSLIPEVSEATADAFSYTGGVSLPKFTSRNLSTSIVVNSGETVVLGGLIKESRTKTVTKVPFFADLPFVGSFFKKEGDSIQRKNLLIFVTAKVLTSSGEEVIVSHE